MYKLNEKKKTQKSFFSHETIWEEEETMGGKENE
jgi:hypothetical protein